MQAYMAYLPGSIFYEVNFRYWGFSEVRIHRILGSFMLRVFRTVRHDGALQRPRDS
jgi:hypothetical protein